MEERGEMQRAKLRESERNVVCNLHEFYYRIVYCRRVFRFVLSVFSVRAHAMVWLDRAGVLRLF